MSPPPPYGCLLPTHCLGIPPWCCRFDTNCSQRWAEQATKLPSGRCNLEDEQWLCLETTICSRRGVDENGWEARGVAGGGEAERMRGALVTLLILFACSTHPLLPLLSNFLLPPMLPRSYHKLWFEMLLFAPAEISFAGKSAASAVQCWEMAGFHQFEAARLQDGKMISMEEFKGKVVLVENTATLWGTTTRDFTQMNELCAKVTWRNNFILNHIFLFLVPWDPGSTCLSLQSVWRSGELWKRRDLECSWACSARQGLRASCHHLPKGKSPNLGRA